MAFHVDGSGEKCMFLGGKYYISGENCGFCCKKSRGGIYQTFRGREFITDNTGNIVIYIPVVK